MGKGTQNGICMWGLSSEGSKRPENLQKAPIAVGRRADLSGVEWAGQVWMVQVVPLSIQVPRQRQRTHRQREGKKEKRNNTQLTQKGLSKENCSHSHTHRAGHLSFMPPNMQRAGAMALDSSPRTVSAQTAGMRAISGRPLLLRWSYHSIGPLPWLALSWRFLFQWQASAKVLECNEVWQFRFADHAHCRPPICISLYVIYQVGCYYVICNSPQKADPRYYSPSSGPRVGARAVGYTTSPARPSAPGP